MKSLQYKAKNGKTYEIIMERLPKTPNLPETWYAFLFKIQSADKEFSYTLAIAPIIVNSRNWSEEKSREVTLKKAQDLLDQGREEKIKLIFMTIVRDGSHIDAWMPL